MGKPARDTNLVHPNRRRRKVLQAGLGVTLAAGLLAAVFWYTTYIVRAGILQWVLDTQADWDGYSAVKTNVVSTAAGDIELQRIWSAVTSNTTMNIWAIDLLSATSGKAVANNGSNSDMLSWNGTAWSKEQTISGDWMYALDMVSSSAGWSVGDDGGGRDAMYYYNGTSWSLLYTNKATTPMYAVSMNGTGFGWAAGRSGNAVYCTTNCSTAANWARWGTTFRDGGGTARDVWDMQLLSATSGWAVGANGSSWRYSGGTSNSAWSFVSTGTTAILYDVFALSASEVWAVGANGTVLYYDGSGWVNKTAEANKNITMYGVHALDTNSDGKTDKVWIVGSSGWIGEASCSGTPLTCTWTWTTAPGFTGILRDVQMLAPADGWAVGDSGTIFHYNYASSGTAEYVLDAGVVSDWLSHSYDATPGAAGAVSFQWATSDDGLTWSAWSGDIGAVANARYLKQRITLGTSDPTQTPRVHASTVSFNRPPLAPTGLTATPGSRVVQLTWNPNNEPDLAGYNIYRSTDGTNFVKVNASVVTGTSYTDTGLTNGTLYYYRITALDTGNNESAPSSIVSVTPGYATWPLDTQADWDGYSAVKTNVVSTAAGDIQIQAGTTWASVTSSTSAGTMDIWSVDMFHGTFGKAVANNGTNSDILTWNGTSWSRDVTLSGVLLYAIDVVSPTSAWAVGGCGGKDCIYYWNGSTWSQIVNNKAGNVLYAVSMIDGDSGWAAGNGGVSLYCTSNCSSGANWVVGPIFKDSQKSAGAAQTVWDIQMIPEYGMGWAVGGNGTVWTMRDNRAGPLDNIVIPKNPLAQSGVVFYDVYAVSGIDAWTVGASGKVMYYDGTNWNDKTAEVNKNITMYGVHAVDTNGDRKTDKVWIIGSGGNIGVGTCSGSPLVTCTWTWSTAPGFSGNLYDTFMHNANAGWAVGQDNGSQGMIFKYGGYPSSGTAQYTYDAGQRVKWLTHAYAATLGSAGSVVFEWAYSDDGSTWSPWQSSLPTNRNSRWLRQKIGLSTSDWSLTPVVHSSVVAYNPDGTEPATPTGLSATAGDGQATLSWNPNGETDLYGYNVYRATSAGGPYTKINSETVSGTTYTATGLTNGTTYYFRITAVDLAENESPQTAYVSATPVNTAPAAPTGLTATAGDSRVTLNWTANTEWDLAGYNIYRATSDPGPYTKINDALVTGTTYAATGLTNGTTYYFKITAVDATALESAQSASASATPRDYTAPAAPTGLMVTAGDSQLTLDWTANSEPDLAGYNIYRSLSQTGPFTRINTSLVVTNTYLNTGLANGITYWYTVTAVDTSGNESAQSTAKSGMPKDATAPAAPTNLTATPRNAKVVLAWDANTEPDLKGYHVYRSTDGSNFNKITGAPVTANRYSDAGLSNLQTYWYKVTAVDVSTNESVYSNTVSAVPNSRLYSGPSIVKTQVHTLGGVRTARVLFTPEEDGVSYTVYKHAYGDGRMFYQVGSSVYYSNGAMSSPDPNWGMIIPSPIDTTTYVYYNDTNITDYAEYYYFVKSSTDAAWPVDEETGKEYPPVEDYNVTRAFPPDQTRHGEFTEFTGACTGCHGMHSALSSTKLLKGKTITDLCASCHDGSGSKYDMVFGRVRTGADWSTYTANPAGPYGTQLKDVAGAPTMNSVHNVYRDGLLANASPSATAAQFWQAPGSTYLSAPNPDPGTWTRELTCGGCHDTHNRSQNYRLLRTDFDAGDYLFPDNSGVSRAKVAVRGVSEINLGYPGGGQMASRYLTGNSGDTGAGITNFCTGCHRAFAGPFNEKYPSLKAGYDPYDPVYENVYNYMQESGYTNADNDSLDNPGTHGWKRHMMAMPAENALLYAGDRIIDPGKTGVTGNQARLVDWDGTNLQRYVPLEGPYEENGNPGNGNGYARNKVVCLTCHVPHGSPRAAGGIGPDGEILNLENAYRNDKLNNTDTMPRSSGDCPSGTTATQVDGEWYCEGTVGSTVYESGRHPLSGYLHYRQNGLIYGSSSVLARFEPFASVCWRCHSTK